MLEFQNKDGSYAFRSHSLKKFEQFLTKFLLLLGNYNFFFFCKFLEDSCGTSGLFISMFKSKHFVDCFTLDMCGSMWILVWKQIMETVIGKIAKLCRVLTHLVNFTSENNYIGYWEKWSEMFHSYIWLFQTKTSNAPI